jgi:hypothetical protein
MTVLATASFTYTPVLWGWILDVDRIKTRFRTTVEETEAPRKVKIKWAAFLYGTPQNLTA